MKKTVYIYCGDDGRGAKQLAASLRSGDVRVFLHAADGFIGVADPRCDEAIVMPDVQLWRRDRINAAYGLTRQEYCTLISWDLPNDITVVDVPVAGELVATVD